VEQLQAYAVTAAGSVRSATAETALTSDEHVVLARSPAEARQLAAAYFARVAPAFVADNDAGHEDDQDNDQNGDERR
jgi:hypothetical protein